MEMLHVKMRMHACDTEMFQVETRVDKERRINICQPNKYQPNKLTKTDGGTLLEERAAAGASAMNPITLARQRQRQRMPRHLFYFYIIFLIYQKCILFFFCKFVTRPPVHLAEQRYRQMDRR